MCEIKGKAEGEFLFHTIVDTFTEHFFSVKTEFMRKGPFDIVTGLDLAIEESIIEKISQMFPGDNILSEEKNSDTKITGRTWVIDPIDGTFNMAGGIPIFCVQGAFIKDGETTAAVIYIPMLKELYTATKGGGAFLNGEQIRVSHGMEAETAMISFGDFIHGDDQTIMKQQNMMRNALKSVAKIRMLGSAGVEFSYVAAGRLAGCVIFTENEWDLRPGMLLCEEAGAIVKKHKIGQKTCTVATADENIYNIIFSS